MTNSKKLYSLNGNFPERLPERVIVNGLTYTGLSDLPEYELEKLGFSGPYYWPSNVDNNKVVIFDSEKKSLFSRDKTLEEKLQEEPEKWENIRAIRDKILKETDWIVLKCYEKDELVPENYVKYRQELRDIPQKYQYTWEVNYPTLEIEPDEEFPVTYDFINNISEILNNSNSSENISGISTNG